jgi:hypothetical protein
MADGFSIAPILENAALQYLQDAVNQSLGSQLLTIHVNGGLSLGVAPPGEPTLALDNLQFGSGGVSGHLHIDGLSVSPLSAQLFGGFTVALTAFELVMANGAFVSTHIGGQLTIPYFTNADGSSETVDIEVIVRADGSLAVTLAAVQTGATTPDGLVDLNYSLPAGSGIELMVASLEVTRSASGVWQINISGSIQIETADIQWPKFDLNGLQIDSQGHVSINGGWIDLPSHTALDFYGFHVALQKLGFGTDPNGDRWIGFNGDINLIDGVSLGGSVQGMRINIDNGSVSFSGVSVDFAIPGVLSFSGEIEHIQLQSGDDPTKQGLPANFPTPANIFAGGVDISIEAAGDLEITGNFVVAQVPIGGSTQTAFFLALDAELPVGIPLFLDVALYGLEGLFALNLQPDPVSHGNTWWEWYKFPNNGGAGINVNGPTYYTASDANKWLNIVPGAFALGAGATIGTQDDGFTVSAAIAFVLMLPGPVISFIGKADILSKRIGGPSQDANFQAMATYDGNSSTFDLVIEAHYSIPVVLDIEATAELYVAPPDWYFALGKPPHDKRVRARIFDLFESDAYFVISQSGLVTGTWTGYKNSWSFGPLSASLDAYLATRAAIQWSPLQIAGGIELHGDVQLSAFGIHIGLTADALLEGTAPNPFWVYGSFHVELDLPWPLPNIGATVSLSWGGNNGPPPPVPLALNTVNATSVDHGTSDRYELLAHRANAPREVPSGLSVLYDSGTPGILAPQPAGYWSGIDPNVANDWWTISPDLAPSQLAWAPLVPQDSHFTLTFAHGANDLYPGFAAAQPVPPDQAVVHTPAIVGADDMSNINPQPPAVQWLIKHDLWEVALFQYIGGAWQKLAASPQHDALYPLPGVWLIPDPAKNAGAPDSMLKVTPFTLHVTDPVTASWSMVGAVLGTIFVDQELHVQAASGEAAVLIGNGPFSSMPPGLLFPASETGGATASITFPGQVKLLEVRAVMLGEGEFPILQPSLSADGAALQATATSDSTGIYVFTVDPNAPAVNTLGIDVYLYPVLLVSVTYKRPDVPMPILPSAPAFYALKVTTGIGAGRPDSSGNAAYQPAQDGNPVIEFAYFQCASGPGTAVLVAPTPPPGTTYASPLPYELPPLPALALAANAPASAFPQGGRLGDLITYLQWSWPPDGNPAAYYGYDVNVEFNESYVHALYLTFAYGGAIKPPYVDAELLQALHFRCVDRNNTHTLLSPAAVDVPSIPEQSAVVAGVWNLQYPSTIAGDRPPSRQVVTSAGQLIDKIDHAVSTKQFTGMALDTNEASLLTKAAATAGITVTQAGLGSILHYNPRWGSIILHQLQELQAAEQARALWFAPLQPRTHYTVDVVAGPLFNRERYEVAGGGSGLLQNIFTAQDAIGTLAALQQFLAHEEALTTLARVQFATSRYATFEDHVANAVAQTNNAPGAPPIRRYPAPAGITAAGWLADPAHNDINRQNSATAYLNARNALLQMAAAYNTMFDPLLPRAQTPPEPGFGRAALAANRGDVQAAWSEFSTATSAIFDALVAALNRSDLVSNIKYVPPPDTEISLVTFDNDARVTALVVESPEPLDWRRLWQWVTLNPANTRSRPLPPPTVLWSSDGTRALIVPEGRPFGFYVLSLRFQGNLGPEVPCITANGAGITGAANFAAIQLSPIFRRNLPHVGDVPLATAEPA